MNYRIDKSFLRCVGFVCQKLWVSIFTSPSFLMNRQSNLGEVHGTHFSFLINEIIVCIWFRPFFFCTKLWRFYVLSLFRGDPSGP